MNFFKGFIIRLFTYYLVRIDTEISHISLLVLLHFQPDHFPLSPNFFGLILKTFHKLEFSVISTSIYFITNSFGFFNISLQRSQIKNYNLIKFKKLLTSITVCVASLLRRSAEQRAGKMEAFSLSVESRNEFKKKSVIILTLHAISF